MSFEVDPSFRVAPIKQIYFLQKEIEEKWKQMQDETIFHYDAPLPIFGMTSSLFERKKKENTNRLPKDLKFWEKVDNFVLDVKKPLFPFFFANNTTTYEFFGEPEAEEMKNDIHALKQELAKEVADYNKRIEPGSRQIQDKNDILLILQEKGKKERFASERISQAKEQSKAQSKENTVVILILCHGAYIVNENLTIDKIAFPETKLGEIVKQSVFGKEALSDFDYTSRNPKDRTDTRYSEEVIKEKLKDAYEKVLNDTSSLINRAQQKKRDIRQKYIVSDKQACKKSIGLLKDSCIHVGFEFSHVPLLRKVYGLDDPISADPKNDGFRRGEFAHGIVFMFENDEGNLIQKNLNRYNDFLWLQQNEYINIPFNVRDRVRHWGTIDADLSNSQLGGFKSSELLMTRLDTEFLMRIIESFPEKYNFFKIVDSSCGVLRKIGTPLTSAEEDIVLQRYWVDMQCGNPEDSKGGRRKRKRKSKTFKGNKSKKQQRKANKKRKTKKY
jgi:hypothetical protein